MNFGAYSKEICREEKMDINSLYYFIELNKDLSKGLTMTKTAERLFITQQTLSNHIQRLEKEYGVELFHRTPKMTLTDAGIHMLASAHNIIEEERKIANIINDIKHQESGILRLGTSTQRGINCLPVVLPVFSERYPKVELHLTDAISSVLQEMILNDDIDLALTTVLGIHPLLIQEFVQKSQIYLCISDKLLKHYYPENYQIIKLKGCAGITVGDIKNLPFLIFESPNGLHNIMNRCFEEADITPHVYMSTRYAHLTSQICSSSLAACFMSQITLLNQMSSLAKDVNIFPLLFQSKPVFHKMCLIRHKKHYIPTYSQYFISLLKKHFQQISDVSLARIIK